MVSTALSCAQLQGYVCFGSRQGLFILHTLPCIFFFFFFNLPGKFDDNGLCCFVSELLVSRRIGPDFGESVERKLCMHFNICV